MFGNFEEEARKVLINAKKEMFELNHPYVSSEHLLLSILNGQNDVSLKLKKYNLNYQIFKNEIIKILGKGSKKSEWFLYTPLLKRVLENAVIDAKDNNNGVVTVHHLFVSLLEEGEGVAIRVLLGMNIDLDKLYDDFSYKGIVKNGSRKLLVEDMGINLNDRAISGGLDPVTGREKEIRRVLEILSRRYKNNPILVGDAGVGKTAIVEEIANRIVNNDVPLFLQNKKIISLDMGSLVAGTKYRGEFEERINKILKEASENDDIILFIDEVHTLVGAGGAEGAIDASNIFKPALSRGKIRCIGATTMDEYKKFIEKDSALDRRFEKVIVNEPDKKTVRDILFNLKNVYENYHNVKLENNIIDLIANLSGKYIYNRKEPDRSIDVLDEVCARVSIREDENYISYKLKNKKLKDIVSKKKKAIIDNNFQKASLFKGKECKLMDEINNLELLLYKKKKKKVTLEDVAEVISTKTGIPVFEILGDKKNIIKDVDKFFKKKIVGQDEAINSVSNVIKKIKLGFNDRCYSFMFCGPSGVGKTELALLFGKNLVGNNVIKLDMSEYKEEASISKIIGSPPGYVGYNDNNILDIIKEKPYSVLILDEIEKANSSVINLFLQVLDEGKIKNSRGQTIRFDNVVIIMTSNVGFLKENVGFNSMASKKTKLNDNFSIPFINRVDSIVNFNYLSYADIKKIVSIKLDLLIKKYNEKIDVIIGDNIYDEVTELCDYETYGARKLDKIIKDRIEIIIINKIIDGDKKVIIDSLFQTN